MKSFKGAFWVFALWILFGHLPAVAQEESHPQLVIEGRKNSKKQQEKPYVILISADGFRHDYAEKYQANNILKLGKEGVQASSMIPSFPSVTFSNHYTLVTGLYPSHHGLVGNRFYDPIKGSSYSMADKEKVGDGSWYGGTPIWVLAEQQRMVTANLFWIGSEAEIKGIRPSYYYNYTEDISIDERIKTVVDWLNLPEDKRPHFITFYLSEPDKSGHWYGPDASETQAAVKMVDSTIYELTKAVETTGLPVNFIFVSDHGMTAVDRENPIPVPEVIDTAKFIMPSIGTMIDLHAKDKADILPLYEKLKKQEKDYKVYLKADMPEHLHYGAKNDKTNRIGDILLLPEWPKVFSNRKPNAGYHGFDPYKVKDMHTVFYAWGPAFKSGIEIPAFESIHVYPLISEILGLNYTEKIDGRKEVLLPILK